MSFKPLPHENRQEFENIADNLCNEFSPEGENEHFLVDLMIEARCRLLRLERLENLAFDEILTEPGTDTDPDGRILAAMGRSGNILDKIGRYRAAAERSYYKALRELTTSRARAQKAEATALDNYIKQVGYAPMPGEVERHAREADQPKLQNEPNVERASAGGGRALAGAGL